MKKTIDSKLLISIILVIQAVGLFFLTTVWGKIIFVLGFVAGLIITFYNYKKNIILKEDFIIFLVISAIFLLTFMLGYFLTSQFFSYSSKSITRIIGRVLIMCAGIYIYKINN